MKELSITHISKKKMSDEAETYGKQIKESKNNFLPEDEKERSLTWYQN